MRLRICEYKQNCSFLVALNAWQSTHSLITNHVPFGSHYRNGRNITFIAIYKLVKFGLFIFIYLYIYACMCVGGLFMNVYKLSTCVWVNVCVTSRTFFHNKFFSLNYFVFQFPSYIYIYVYINVYEWVNLCVCRPIGLVGSMFTKGLETGVQSSVETYQRHKKWYLISPCLTLSTLRYVSKETMEKSREWSSSLFYTSV